MPGPFFQNVGGTFNNLPTGILSSAGANGTANSNNSTNIFNINFNINTAGPNNGNFYKGSLLELNAGGHAPDILNVTNSNSQITILTATNVNAAVTLKAFSYPGLITGEAANTGNNNTLLSSYYVGASGIAGVVDQTDCSNAIYGDLVFIAGGAFTPAAGGYLPVWFLESEDGATNFEKVVANTALPRAPDAIIPLFNSAYAAGDRAWAKGVQLPSCPFKTLIQNLAGAVLPATWGIWLLPQGIEY